MSKIIVCGHFQSSSIIGYSLSGKREPTWLEFPDEESAREAIAKHNIQVVKVYKAEELPVVTRMEVVVNKTFNTVTEWLKP